MLEHRSLLDSLVPDRRDRSLATEQSEPLIAAVLSRRLSLLQCSSPPALQGALSRDSGLQLPAPQTAAFFEDNSLLWLTPSEWLLDSPADIADSTVAAIAPRLNVALAAITDVTDAFAYFELSGSCVTDILMTGCGLDLRPSAFPPGRLARTFLANVPTIVWNPGGSVQLRCLIDRTFASHFRDWFRDRGT
jgi:sarcosine oxidase subunit gamma